MFRFLWFKKQVRKHTKPIPIRTASKWSKRISIAYAVIAWHTLGLIVYKIYQGGGDVHKELGIEKPLEMELSPAAQFALKAGIEKATIKRLSRYSEVSTTEFDLNETKAQLEKKKLEREEQKLEEEWQQPQDHALLKE